MIVVREHEKALIGLVTHRERRGPDDRPRTVIVVMLNVKAVTEPRLVVIARRLIRAAGGEVRDGIPDAALANWARQRIGSIGPVRIERDLETGRSSYRSKLGFGVNYPTEDIIEALL